MAIATTDKFQSSLEQTHVQKKLIDVSFYTLALEYSSSSHYQIVLSVSTQYTTQIVV